MRGLQVYEEHIFGRLYFAIRNKTRERAFSLFTGVCSLSVPTFVQKAFFRPFFAFSFIPYRCYSSGLAFNRNGICCKPPRTRPPSIGTARGELPSALLKAAGPLLGGTPCIQLGNGSGRTLGERCGTLFETLGETVSAVSWGSVFRHPTLYDRI